MSVLDLVRVTRVVQVRRVVDEPSCVSPLVPRKGFETFSCLFDYRLRIVLGELSEPTNRRAKVCSCFGDGSLPRVGLPVVLVQELEVVQDFLEYFNCGTVPCFVGRVDRLGRSVGVCGAGGIFPLLLPTLVQRRGHLEIQHIL